MVTVLISKNQGCSAYLGIKVYFLLKCDFKFGSHKFIGEEKEGKERRNNDKNKPNTMSAPASFDIIKNRDTKILVTVGKS